MKEGPFARILFTEAGGIVPERLVIEEEARTTAESPDLLAALLPEAARGEGWLLVTSAWHMPRSVGVFEAAGWRVVPYPVDYRTHPVGGWYPGLVGGLSDLTMAVHEWVGLAAYRVMGRTSEVFPGPGRPLPGYGAVWHKARANVIQEAPSCRAAFTPPPASCRPR